MTATDPNSIRARFQDLGVWTRGAERAPYKPLLLLHVLGRYTQGSPRLISFETLDNKLRPLFVEFGPSRAKYSTVYPFWYLRNDGVWEVPGGEHARVREGKASEPTKTWPRDESIHGGVPEEIFKELKAAPEVMRDIAADLLDAHFSESLHADILAAVGLDVEWVRTESRVSRRRDPRFRARVLRVYQRRCAVCGFDARLGDALVGIEAAHIKWHQAGGPGSVPNGLALCSLHHKLFDRGAFTLTLDGRVEVSEELTGAQSTSDWVVRFHGEHLALPSRPSDRPAGDFIDWHREEVFREPGRHLG